jgi:hypothetical protein
MEENQIDYKTARKNFKIKKINPQGNKINNNKPKSNIGDEIALELHKVINVIEKTITLIQASKSKQTNGLQQTLNKAKTQFQDLIAVNDPIRNG